jgi:hypothetical protein
MKKIKKIKGKLSLTRMKGGRIPIPKSGGAMKAKKGRGSYTRKSKHKGRSSYGDCPFSVSPSL